MIRTWPKATASVSGVASLLSVGVETEMERKATSSKVVADGRDPEMRGARWTWIAVVLDLHLDSTAGNVHGGSMEGVKKQSTMRESDPPANRFSHPS